MSGFFIHTSNSFSELARQLALFLGEDRPLEQVLRPDVVVLPGAALARRLKLEIATFNGVVANLDCPFPRAFFESKVFQPLRRALGVPWEQDDYAPANLSWRIFALLDDAGLRHKSADLDYFLKQTGDELSRLRLAFRLADLFDRYLVARPELIRAWERGENPLQQLPAAGWQKLLWRRLTQEIGHRWHPAALHELVNRMFYPEYFPTVDAPDSSVLRSVLPARLHLFGFAVLPPTYLDLFHALSRLIEVRFFYLNPCREYWGDQYRLEPFRGPGPASAGENSSDLSLLASWGRLGRPFFETVSSLEVSAYQESFVDPQAGTLLSSLQQAILRLENLPLPAGDDSLQLHRCHSRRREVEVLRDTILAALEGDAQLEPGDILVMAPDIELYAPDIEAVFSAVNVDGHRFIPFVQAAAQDSGRWPAPRALLMILRLLPGRFPVRDLFELFSLAPVRRRFGVEEHQLEILRRRLRRTGMSWGLDGIFRRQVVGIDFAEFSLQWGFDRLLAGYALAGNQVNEGYDLAAESWNYPDGRRLLPLPGLEGDEAVALGGFLAFVALLQESRELSLEPLAIGDWPEALRHLIQAFLKPASEDEGFARLEAVLQALPWPDDVVNHKDRTLELASVTELWEKTAAKLAVAPVPNLAGGTVFASMLPMRALPASMICLLGLNDGDFPRGRRAPSYDLIAARPRAGDRNDRDEDRFLFLETLLSARKRLVLSYVGRDPKDNHLRPPALPVSELLAYLDRFGSGSLSREILFDHPPQPFSPRYFTQSPGTKIFTYDQQQAVIAGRLLSRPPAGDEDRFAGVEVLSLPGRIKAADLRLFLRNPARYFLDFRLGVDPEARLMDEFAENEVFVLEPLENYALYDEILQFAERRQMQDRSGLSDDLVQKLSAAGRLPLKAFGEQLCADKLLEINVLLKKRQAFSCQKIPLREESLALNGRAGNVCLECSFAQLYRGEDGIKRQLFSRPVKTIKATDRLYCALAHNLLAATSWAGEIAQTCFLGLADGAAGRLDFTTSDIVDPRRNLDVLLAVYEEGCNRPLPFLPSLSFVYYDEYCKQLTKSGDRRAHEAGRAKVKKTLDSSYAYDADDAAFSYCFAGRWSSPDFWDDFRITALILGPILF